jgi:hypothetical protein
VRLAAPGAALALLMSGCFAPQFRDGQYACAGGGACPSGLSCGADGLCHTGPGLDAATGPDGPEPDAAADGAPPFDRPETPDARVDGVAPPDLGIDAGDLPDQGPPADAPIDMMASTVIFSDNFDDGVTDPFWTIETSTATETVAESGGALVLSPPPNDGHYFGYNSASTYDFHGKYVQVEVLEAVQGEETILKLGVAGRTSDTYFQMDLDTTQLYCAIENAGPYTTFASVPYDQVAHLWWRMRADQTTFYCDTSPDGNLWTEQGSIPAPFPLDSLEFDLIVGSSTGAAMPGEARFDNFSYGTW